MKTLFLALLGLSFLAAFLKNGMQSSATLAPEKDTPAKCPTGSRFCENHNSADVEEEDEIATKHRKGSAIIGFYLLFVTGFLLGVIVAYLIRSKIFDCRPRAETPLQYRY